MRIPSHTAIQNQHMEKLNFFFLPQPVYLQCFRRESPAELSLLSKWIVPVEVAEMDVHVAFFGPAHALWWVPEAFSLL